MLGEIIDDKELNGGEILLKCDCGEEVLAATHDEDCGVDFAMYIYRPGMSFRDKIRFIWRILRHGRPYSDQICLNYTKVRELKNFLNQCLKSHKQQKDIKC